MEMKTTTHNDNLTDLVSTLDDQQRFELVKECLNQWNKATCNNLQQAIHAASTLLEHYW